MTTVLEEMETHVYPRTSLVSHPKGSTEGKPFGAAKDEKILVYASSAMVASIKIKFRSMISKIKLDVVDFTGA